MQFKEWLQSEISGTGDYRDLIPGWKGHATGPFGDPKRMPHDSLFWRNYQFQKQWSTKELENAEKRYKLQEAKAAPKPILVSHSEDMGLHELVVLINAQRYTYHAWPSLELRKIIGQFRFAPWKALNRLKKVAHSVDGPVEH